MSTYLQRLLAFVRDHRFEAHITDEGDAVRFAVPYSSPAGNGVQWFTVRTYAEARRELGY